MILTEQIRLKTQGNCDIIDIAAQVEKKVAESKITSGIVTVFVSGSTAGVTTMEYESGLVSDFKNLWQRLVPNNIQYGHDSAWGDGNGHAHIRASLLGCSLSIPITEGKMTLGTWQQIVLVDFDNRPRTRNVIIHIVGDSNTRK